MIEENKLKVIDSFYLTSRQCFVIGGEIMEGNISVGQYILLDNSTYAVKDVTYLDKVDIGESLPAILCDCPDEQKGRAIAKKLDKSNSIIKLYEKLE